MRASTHTFLLGDLIVALLHEAEGFDPDRNVVLNLTAQALNDITRTQRRLVDERRRQLDGER